MSYKSVLVHIDESARTAQRVAVAASVALLDEAHLSGVALTGVSRFLYQRALADGADPQLDLHLNFLRERANQALAGFAEQVAALKLASFEACVTDDDASDGVNLLARYADLVVIGQTNPAQPTQAVLADFPARVLLGSGRPVLIVPYAGIPAAGIPGAAAPARPFAARQALIAWNGAKEAGRAVSAALPLLRRAEHVHIAIFEPARDAGTDAAITRYLARHGVSGTVSRHAPARQGLKGAGDTGEALLSLAADLAADLLVMGAYGHSRLRETVLGGVTRTVLASMTTPVLMAH